MSAKSPTFGIRSIEISNFRSIEYLKLDFTDANDQPSDIVVLAGPNGSGKTAVLEACLIGLGHSDLLQRLPDKSAIRRGATKWSITVDIDTNFFNKLFQQRCTSAWDDAKGIANGDLPASPIPCIYFSSWRSPKLVGALPISTGKRGKKHADTEANRVRLAKQYFINRKAHEKMRDHPVILEQTEIDLKRLNEVWAKFYPTQLAEFVVDAVSDDPDDDFDIFLRFEESTRISVDMLSSGQMELFAFFATLIRLKTKEGILIVDEPELHLDPQWHVLMLRAYRSLLPKMQIIVATHSPSIRESVYSFQRHFLIPADDPRAKAWQLPELESAAQ